MAWGQEAPSERQRESVLGSTKQWSRPVQDGLREAARGRGTLEPTYNHILFLFLSLFQVVLKLLPVNSSQVTQGVRESTTPELEN